MSGALLTPAEVADRCRVSTKTVLRGIRAGRLRASRLGERGAYRVRAEDVDAWIDDTTVSVAGRTEPSIRTLHGLPQRSAATGRLVLSDTMGRRQ